MMQAISTLKGWFGKEVPRRNPREVEVSSYSKTYPSKYRRNEVVDLFFDENNVCEITLRQKKYIFVCHTQRRDSP